MSPLPKKLFDNLDLFCIVTMGNFLPVCGGISRIDYWSFWIANFKLVEHPFQAGQKIFEQEFVVFNRISTTIFRIRHSNRGRSKDVDFIPVWW